MKRLANRVLDFVYPVSCHLCESPLSHGRYLCESCSDSMRYIEAPFCSKCGECYDAEFSGEFICPNCHGLDLSYEFARGAVHAEGMGRDLVHAFKYQSLIHLAGELGKLTEKALEDPRFRPYIDDGLLIPVPLYWLRLRKRRFNQSEEIARKLTKRSGLILVKALKRNRNTQTQTRFTRARRLKNLNGAFVIKESFKDMIQGRSVVLIDDVFTTGATANECARVLLENGVSRVAVLTLLRG